MRLLATFAFFLLSQLVTSAQTKTYQLEGEFKDGTSTGFVYLIDAEKQSVQIEPIVSGKFVFQVRKEKDLELRNLFMSADSLKNYEFFKTNRRDIDTRLLAVEDAKIVINNTIKQAVVIGTTFNQQLNFMNKVSVDGNYPYFFEQFPDSPVSLLFLKTLARLEKVQGLAINVNCNLLFSKLSKRLRESDEGKALYEEIK